VAREAHADDYRSTMMRLVCDVIAEEAGQGALPALALPASLAAAISCSIFFAEAFSAFLS
jgi:hypothetical protein